MTLEQEVAFDFDFKYTPGEPATRDYPGDGPEVEITKVRLNGVEIPLSAITAQMYDEMIEHVVQNYYWWGKPDDPAGLCLGWFLSPYSLPHEPSNYYARPHDSPASRNVGVADCA